MLIDNAEMTHAIHKSTRRHAFLVVLFLSCVATPAYAANFTVGAQRATRFGVHEISLAGKGHGANPFALSCDVAFRRPSGTTVTVPAFYDGADTWRARVYVNEAGSWGWSSRSDHHGLDGHRGVFVASASTLRGKLRPHVADSKQWMTEDGRWFLNMNDTVYRLFSREVRETDFREYVRDVERLGFTSVRSAALGGWEWDRRASSDGQSTTNWPWEGEDTSRYDLPKFQTTDTRLRYLLDHQPDLYVQLILFGLVQWGTDRSGETWDALPAGVKRDTMRYMIARWAAFPQIFWLLVNDLHLVPSARRNFAFARDVGRYFRDGDPWRSLMAAGPQREQTYPFASAGDMDWSTYIHIETRLNISASHARTYAAVPQHVFDAEDYYEQDWPEGNPRHPRYFYRRLFWSWLLAGGSSNYGGRYLYVHPYSRTGSLVAPTRGIVYKAALTGADSLIYIRSFFARTGVTLAGWVSDDALARDLDGHASRGWIGRVLFGDDSRRVKCARRADGGQIIVYHPNAREGFVEEGHQTSGREINVDPGRRARFTIDLRRFQGDFDVVWTRARDGETVSGSRVPGGGMRELAAPWPGEDVVAYFVKGAR